MPLIPFPNIPALPGVPAIPRLPGVATVARAAIGVIQGALWQAFQSDVRWGIFDANGNSIFGDSTTGILAALTSAAGLGTVVSTNAVEYSKEVRSSDFPVERGSFANYNKVESPGTPSVTMAITGSESDRSAFLLAIDTACKSTELFDVVTPEVTYVGYSIDRYNYQRRAQRGATLLIVELVLKEVRQVSAQYTQAAAPKQASAAAPVDNGKVQAQAPEQSTLKKLAARFGF